MSNNVLITTHKLNFESRQWFVVLDGLYWHEYRIGTVHGLWRSTDTTYDILAFENTKPGNGHLDDVFQWFENSCKRDKKSLKIMEMMNETFKTHLMVKRGFVEIPYTNHLIKHFK